MGRFYGGGTIFPEPTVRQVAEGGSPPAPESLPVGGTVPSPPDGFAPYMIRPELVPGNPFKAIVPPLFDRKTAASLIKDAWAGDPSQNPVTPRGARPVKAPAPVQQIFITKSEQAVQRAVNSGYRASNMAREAALARSKADALAYEAKKAAKRAAVDPTPAAQGEALAREMAAQQADSAAVRAAAKAYKAEEQGYRDAASAEQEATVVDRTQVLDDGTGMMLDIPPIPGELLPVPEATGGLPLGRIGVGAAGGFFLAGPVGALLGAVGGLLSAKVW